MIAEYFIEVIVLAKLIQICGDPTVDWLMNIRNKNISGNSPYFWSSAPSVELSSQAGGPELIYGLLAEMLPDEYQPQIESIHIDPALLERPKEGSITRVWTVWEHFNQDSFRISEWCQCETGQWDYVKNKLKGIPQLLIIEDNDYGFRDCPGGWPEMLDEPGSQLQHIILKTGKLETAKNPLIQAIHEKNLAPKTTLIISLNDLRACAVKIGLSLSWERLLQEIAGAVQSHQCLPLLANSGEPIPFQRIIITIGTSGAVIIEQGGNILVFDRTGQEGDFEQSTGGQMIGYNTCLVGALVATWVHGNCNIEKMDWKKGTRIGIGLARHLHLEGFKLEKSQIKFPFTQIKTAYDNRINFETNGDPPDYNKDDNQKKIWNLGVFECQARNNEMENQRWTIIKDSILGKNQLSLAEIREKISDDAKRIVIKGPGAALPNVPVEEVKGWRSADRNEIEGVRSVFNAIRDHLENNQKDTPLSVAVFGPPGSGKSFVIREIARALNIEEEAQLTFNLSQFESPQQLPFAFHRIRDLHLKGKTPLVFWDEFDTSCQSNELGWLRYFLAPMQDGVFMEQGLTHPVGGGIYVFAGGTCKSFKDFCSYSNHADVAAKKPDFISRLSAYIDIQGINGIPDTINDDFQIIRRAFLLNGFLKKYAPQLTNVKEEIQIEDNVVNAFLKVTSYRHGARSLETLIKMSRLSGKNKFELSSLPPEHLLKMHVDLKEFNHLLNAGHQQEIRIGVTGHMSLDPSRIGEIEAGIEKAVAFITRKFPESYFTVLSPMAVGSDRLVTKKIILKPGFSKLIAILPTDQEEYIKDFGLTDDHRADYHGAERRQEFHFWLSENATEIITMPPTPTRDEAYRESGYFIVENCDLMIAIWDDDKAQGTGGTAEIVDRAIQCKKPLIHIWAENYNRNPPPATETSANTGKYGQIRYRNFPNCRFQDTWEDYLENLNRIGR